MHFTTTVSTEILAQHLDAPNWVVFDCRFALSDTAAGEAAYRAGHIPQARYAHLDRDLSSPISAGSGRHPLPDPDTLARKLGAWGVGDATQVVVYDDAGGAMAGRMWWLLRWLGHERAALLDGGITQWIREGRPLDSEIPEAAPRTFTPRRDDRLWLSTSQVQQGIAAQELLLVDARGAARFRGEEEPIDPVAGHIPGALNRPLQDNLAADGRFRAPAELRRQFAALIGDAPPEAWFTCAARASPPATTCWQWEIAGLSGSRLYPGSWSEWIRDPARPVAKG